MGEAPKEASNQINEIINQLQSDPQQFSDEAAVSRARAQIYNSFLILGLDLSPYPTDRAQDHSSSKKRRQTLPRQRILPRLTGIKGHLWNESRMGEDTPAVIELPPEPKHRLRLNREIFGKIRRIADRWNRGGVKKLCYPEDIGNGFYEFPNKTQKGEWEAVRDLLIVTNENHSDLSHFLNPRFELDDIFRAVDRILKKRHDPSFYPLDKTKLRHMYLSTFIKHPIFFHKPEFPLELRSSFLYFLDNEPDKIRCFDLKGENREWANAIANTYYRFFCPLTYEFSDMQIQMINNAAKRLRALADELSPRVSRFMPGEKTGPEGWADRVMRAVQWDHERKGRKGSPAVGILSAPFLGEILELWHRENNMWIDEPMLRPIQQEIPDKPPTYEEFEDEDWHDDN